MGNGSRSQTMAIVGGLLLIAVLLGLGLRTIVGNDPNTDDAGGVTVPAEDSESDGQPADGSDDVNDSDTTAGDADDGSASTQTTTDSSSTQSSAPTSSGAGAEPSYVELSDLVLTRTGECRSLTVAADAIIQVASGGETTTFDFPGGGGLIEGTVGERSSLTVGEQVSAPVGDEWNVSVFSREHLAEGAYSRNHSSAGPASGRYSGPARMQVSYEISENNGEVTVSPLVLSAGSDCQTVAPTVVVTYTSSNGTESFDNGTASQTPALFGQPLNLLDDQRFDLADGWSLTVFVRDDWSGRSYSVTHDGATVVSEVLAANDQGDPELSLSYSVSIG